jgi:branched-chain amino acid transport system substrate-binding protein
MTFKMREAAAKLTAAAGLLAGLLLPAAALAQAPSSTLPPVKIGLTIGLTGPTASSGKAGMVTMKIWAEDINARGGLLNRKVELVYYDDQGQPSAVPGLVTKLINVDKVDILLSQGTNMTAPAMPVVMSNNRLIVATFALGVNDQFKYGRYFQTMPYGPDGKNELPRGFFEVAAKLNPKPKTVALVGADAEFANNALEGARVHAKRLGFNIVYDKTYPPSNTSFGPILRAIQATKPDLVFVASYPPDSVGIVRAANEVGLKSMMFGGAMVGLQNAAMRQALGNALNGIVNYELYNAEPTVQSPGVKELLTKYRTVAAAEGVDTLGFYLPPTTYATMQIIEQAVKATNSLDSAKLAAYMHATTFKTVNGDIRFGANGEWAEPRILMTQFRNVTGNDVSQFNEIGKQVILYPEKYKSGTVAVPFAAQ